MEPTAVSLGRGDSGSEPRVNPKPSAFSRAKAFPGKYGNEIAAVNSAPWAAGLGLQALFDNGYPGVGSALSPTRGIDYITGYSIAPLRAVDFAQAAYDLGCNIKGAFDARSKVRKAENEYDRAAALIDKRLARSSLLHGLVNNQVRDLTTDPGNLIRTLVLPGRHLASAASSGSLAGLTGFGGLTYVVGGFWNRAKANRSIDRSVAIFDRFLGSKGLGGKRQAELGNAVSLKGEWWRQFRTTREERRHIRDIVALTHVNQGIDTAKEVAAEFKSGKRKPGDLTGLELGPGVDDIQHAILSTQKRGMGNERNRKFYSAMHVGFGLTSIGVMIPLALAFPVAGIVIDVAASIFILGAYTVRFGVAAWKRRKQEKTLARKKDDARSYGDTDDAGTRKKARTNEILAARFLSKDLEINAPEDRSKRAHETLERAGMTANQINALKGMSQEERAQRLGTLLFSQDGEVLRRSVTPHRGILDIIRGSQSSPKKAREEEAPSMPRAGTAVSLPAASSSSHSISGSTLSSGTTPPTSPPPPRSPTQQVQREINFN